MKRTTRAFLCKFSGTPAIAVPNAMVLAGMIAISGCSSSGTTGLDRPAASDPQASASEEIAFDEVQDPRAYCPKIVMRAGTETLNVYPDNVKPDDPDRRSKLRFRATIGDLARECNYAGPVLNMRVGVRGRVISGPSGETGIVAMPIRIAVTQGDTVLYSKLHDVAAEIPPGRTNANFTLVDGDVNIPRPEKENVLIYVGYDEQRIDLPNARPPDDEELEPVN